MYNKAWNKYLPVIRILLKRSAAEEQKMDLSRMDFENSGARNRKIACSFNIELENGKLSLLSQSNVARSLVEVLQQDPAAKQLLRNKHFRLSLNSAYQFRLLDISPVEEKEPENVEAAEA